MIKSLFHWLLPSPSASTTQARTHCKVALQHFLLCHSPAVLGSIPGHLGIHERGWNSRVGEAGDWQIQAKCKVNHWSPTQAQQGHTHFPLGEENQGSSGKRPQFFTLLSRSERELLPPRLPQVKLPRCQCHSTFLIFSPQNSHSWLHTWERAKCLSKERHN